MIDLNDMVIFAKVAETKGISPAARVLNMPKSKVSRRMAALEDELGIRLLERSTRSVHLTEAGEIFSRHCYRVVEETACAVESVNYLRETPRGHLRVSASVTIGQHLLSPHIAEFIRKYPDIDLDIQLSDRRVDVIAEGFDVVIRVGELKDSSLVGKKLGSGCARLYASKPYLEKNQSLTRVTDLQKHAVLCRSDILVSNRLKLVGPRNREIEIELQSAVSTGDLTMIRQIASDGGGIAIIPEYLAKSKVAGNPLVNLLPKWRTDEFSYYALYPSHRGITLKARAWVEFIESKL